MNRPTERSAEDLIAELDAAGHRHQYAGLVLAPDPARERTPSQHDSIVINAYAEGPEQHLDTLLKAMADGMVPVGLIMLDFMGEQSIAHIRAYPESGMRKKQAQKFLDEVATIVAAQTDPYGRAMTRAIAEADKAGFTYPVDITIYPASGAARSYTLAHDGKVTNRIGFGPDSPRLTPPFRIDVSDSSQPQARLLRIEMEP